MSASFTPSTEDNLFDMALWNEMLLGWRERGNIFNPSLYQSGDSPYTSMFSIQTAIEALVTDFIAHQYMPEGEPVESLVPMTWDIIKATALGGSGWRRQVQEGQWATPGKAQSGDVVGPWLIEDIQKVLSELKVRYHPNVIYAARRKDGGKSDMHSALVDAVAEASFQYSSAATTDWGSSVPQAIGEIFIEAEDEYRARFQARVADVDARIAGPGHPTGIPNLSVKKAVYYAKAEKQNPDHSFQEQYELQQGIFVPVVSLSDFTTGNDGIFTFGQFPSDWPEPFYPGSFSPESFYEAKSWEITEWFFTYELEYTNS